MFDNWLQKNSPRESTPEALSHLGKVCLLLMILGGLGLVIAECVGALDMDDTRQSSDNMFFYLFSTYEKMHLGLFCAVALATVWLTKRSPKWRIDFGGTPMVWSVAGLAIVLAALGTYLVFLNYPFAMDEYYSDFQASLFAQGKIFAPLPREFSPVFKAATPILMVFNPVKMAWTSNYLPVYSLLRTPFFMVNGAWLLNPLLTGLSILTIAGVVRRMWPGENQLPAVAALLLASSPQFLITGMTAYAMPAHLCANLLWLLLFLHPNIRFNLLAPLLGVLAMGLHQPNVHLLFAIPFCFRLLLTRRWKMAGYFAAVYGIGAFLWLQYMHLKAAPPLFAPPPENASEFSFILHLFHLPGMGEIMNPLVSMTEVLSWQSFALVLFATLGFLNWKKLTPTLKDLSAGLFLSWLFYLLVPGNQGHGWGNRYFFPYLGNLSLLAVAGFQSLQKKSPETTGQILIISSAVALFILLPLRAWEANSVVKPFATTSRFLASLPAKLLIIDVKSIWYGQDLVRNAPGLSNTPKILFLHRLDEAGVKFCSSQRPFAMVQYNQLANFGMKPRAVPTPAPVPHE